MEVTQQSRQRSAVLTRLRMYAMVGLNVALALLVTAGAIWLAGRPGLRMRVDLTVNNANTLDVNAQQVIDNLQAPIEIDVFFRPFMAPLDMLGGEIQERTLEILSLAHEYAPDMIKLNNHPFALPGEGGAELVTEMRELGVSQSNLFVVSNGSRRVAMKLLGEVAEVDLGNPSRSPGAYRPASVIAYRGMESLVKGILRVTRGDEPLVLFATGHGERKIFESEPGDMGKLHTALHNDGFNVGVWDPSEDGPVPAECAVLALVGSQETYKAEETAWIEEYVRAGGSLIAAPNFYSDGGRNSVEGVLSEFGITMAPGFVSRPVLNAAGMAVTGDFQVVAYTVRAEGLRNDHPITDVLRRGDRRVRVVYSRALNRGEKPEGGVLLALVTSDKYSWLDLPDENGEPNFQQDRETEPNGPFALAMTSVFPVQEMGPIPTGENSSVDECRVFALGSAEVFANSFSDVNKDLLLNAFNWAADREFRVSISPIEIDDRRLDLRNDKTLFYVNLIAVWILPLLCLGLAVFSGWRRRR